MTFFNATQSTDSFTKLKDSAQKLGKEFRAGDMTTSGGTRNMKFVSVRKDHFGAVTDNYRNQIINSPCLTKVKVP
jgi:hypothetical protein